MDEFVFNTETGQTGEAPPWIPGGDLVDLLKDVENPVGVEIGVAEGTTSLFLLQKLPTLKHYGIDPYDTYKDWNGTVVPVKEVIDAKKVMKERLAPYAGRFTHLELTSDKAVNHFKNETLDFVFIDGVHTYDQVLKDCRSYWPKVKRGGIFAGHDLRAIHTVKDAVYQFASEVGAPQVLVLPRFDAWYWRKF